ncbi:MAG: hypothetical protein LQ338_004041 [Usnochroma carphineum]|nr:MAG: hypothetical protein LQ338_004041 [Usnochroma carphineum]
MGSFLHACEGEMVCESVNPKIPYFNAPIYLENKTAIGKVDEILGPINQVHFTIKPQEGIVATSFKSGDKFYIGGDKLLPLEKYVAEDLCQAFAEDFPGSSPNRNHHQEQRSLSVQVERRGVVQCAEVEEAVGVVAEGHLGAEVDLEVIEAEEEVAVEEEEEASALAAAVGVEMQTSRDLQGAFEAGVHSHVQGVTDLGMVSGYCMIGHV